MIPENSRKPVFILFTFTLILACVGFIVFYWNEIATLLIDRYFGQNGGISQHLPMLLDSGLLIAEGYIFLLVTKPLVKLFIERGGKKNQTNLVLSFYTYLTWLIIVIILLSTFFKDFGTIIASLGLIGFGVTFALQKPILNLVGWLTIIRANPFSVGERIEVNGIRGDVVSIHTMYTQIQGTRPNAQTKSDQIITIPNELILTNPVMSYSRMGNVFADDITVSVTYESKEKI